MVTTCQCKGDKVLAFKRLILSSRICAVVQYAVLEANAKVNERGPFSHPTPQPISISCQIYYYLPPGSWCAKFGWNRFGRYGSAHAWKKQFCVDFLLTYLSIYLSVYPFLSVFHRISNDRITRQPLTFSQKMVLKIWKTQLRKHLLNTEMT